MTYQDNRNNSEGFIFRCNVQTQKEENQYIYIYIIYPIYSKKVKYINFTHVILRL